jgi:integrase/recombinase XerC
MQYGQDFDAIAAIVAGDAESVLGMPLSDITTESMRIAFAQYAETHSAASILPCWSTWNVLCTYLFISELIAADPMPQVGRPRVPESLPKALPTNLIAALLTALSADPEQRRSDWIEWDRALILTALLAGLRSDELLRANVADARPTDDGAVIQVLGNGDKDRRIPVEASLVHVWTEYLDSRAGRFPATTKQRSPTRGLASWFSLAPLVVGVDGIRITRGTLQYPRPARIPTSRYRQRTRPRRACNTACRTLLPSSSLTPRLTSTP